MLDLDRDAYSSVHVSEISLLISLALARGYSCLRFSATSCRVSISIFRSVYDESGTKYGNAQS